MKTEAEKKREHRSTMRVLDIMEYVASGNSGYTLTEICEGIDAPKSSIFPILHSLVDRKYLILKQSDLKYVIGSSAYLIGNAFLNNMDILSEIRSEMEKIVAVCRETCFCASLHGGDVFYLLKIESPEAIVMTVRAGKVLPAYSTALGKAMLLDYTLESIVSLFGEDLSPITANTIRDAKTLFEELQTFRRDGITYETEESTPDIRCISVPIRQNGVIRMALSVATPTFRYTDQKMECIKQLLLNAKTIIEDSLKKLPENALNRIL